MVCINCGEEIQAHKVKRTRGQAKYCDPSCEKEYWKKKYAGQNTIWGVSSCTVGAINELRVSVDLLRRGYSVFRALSPSCPCDLVLLKDGDVFRVEVTTGHNSSNGKLMHPKKDPQLHDILAVVTSDSIIYFTEHADLKVLGMENGFQYTTDKAHASSADSRSGLKGREDLSVDPCQRRRLYLRAEGDIGQNSPTVQFDRLLPAPDLTDFE